MTVDLANLTTKTTLTGTEQIILNDGGLPKDVTVDTLMAGVVKSTTNPVTRMGGTAQTAQALYSALSGGQANPYAVPGSPLDPALTTGRSADEAMDAVVEAVRPVDGTQDAEASRTSIKDALADVLNQFPNADLLNLQQEQRELAVERFVAADVFRRIDLDIGRTIREKAPNAAIGLGRLKEVREYVRETVSASFRNLREAGQSLVAGRVTQIVQSAIRETFQVFEGYVE